MKWRLTLWMIVLGFCLTQAKANNVRITDKVKVAGQLGKDTIILSFPLKWDNSWRLDENWDAVYLFIKYKRLAVEEPWRHLCIKNSGHRVDAGYTWSVAQTQDASRGVKAEPSNVGLFVFRNSTGAGPASTMVRLAVDISQGDLLPDYRATYEDFKSGKMDISVAAIEMVFVPRGPFYLGDGISYDTFGDEEGGPFLVGGNDSLTLSVKNGTSQQLRPDKVGLPDLYPKGYEGFYCMKYEISQEQYVYFLNKLPYREQKKRIGNNLDQLSAGDYVFGDRTYPDTRNGIILEKRKTAGQEVTGNHGDTAVIFGHNLNQEEFEVNSATDGKTVACNFLTPEDARAYADWVGLRLMTELEYEKVCRLRNPAAPPTGYQYAWNGYSLNIPLGGLMTGTEGTVNEIATGDANVNAGKKFNGPMRCGSFAREGTTFMSVTGASYWGALDLTGNLSEMECNAVAGKQMIGIDGDGSLSSEVISWSKDTIVDWDGAVYVPPYTDKVMAIRYFPTDYHDRLGRRIVIADSFWVATRVQEEPDSKDYHVWRHITLPVPAWPDTLSAYGVRGGSYKDEERDYLAVSARKETDLFKNGVNINPGLSASPRLPYVTFRLVKNVPVQAIKAGRIGLQNNEFRDTAILCEARPYVIKELDGGSSEAAAVLYEWEENEGTGWRKIEGEIKQTLGLTHHWNTDTLLQSVEYRRKSVTPMGEGYSNVVTLTLLGKPHFKPIQTVIDDCNRSEAITGSVKVKADSILWYKADDYARLGVKEVNTTSSVYTPTRAEFPLPGSYEIVCQAYLDGCAVESKANANIAPAYSPDDCPAVVTDDEGNSYQAGILADCRCWLLEPLKRNTPASQVSDEGIRMYNFEDLSGEPSSYKGEGESFLCPAGFFVPTAAEVYALMNGLKNMLAPVEITGPAPYGYIDQNGEAVKGGYYWATIYPTLLETGGYYEFQVQLMTINKAGYVDVIDPTLDPEKFPEEQMMIPDVDGVLVTPSGEKYFPVRCIKAK